MNKLMKNPFSLKENVWANILMCLAIFICMLSFGSCKEGRKNQILVNDVDFLNASCPLSAGKIGELKYAEIEDSCIVLHYYLSEECKQMAWGNPKNVFDERIQYLEIAMLDTTNMQNEPLTKLYYDAFKNGYSIRNQYNFKFDNGIDADVAKTILLPDIFYGKYYNGNMKELCKESLKIRQLNENRMHAGLDIPDSLKSYDLIEDSLFVVGSCVSSNDFTNVWFSQFDLRKNLLKAFKDPSMKSFAKQCVICEKGIGFRYVCLAKKDSICIDFKKNELENILSNYDEVVEIYNKISNIK